MMRLLGFTIVGLAFMPSACGSRVNEKTSGSSLEAFSGINSGFYAGDNISSGHPLPGPRNQQGLSLLDTRANEPNQKFLNVCLDRDSFSQRGYSNLGSFPSQKTGVFLSVFNAVQANNPNDIHHPWFDASIPVNHRGISAHLDYWAKFLHGSNKSVEYFAYDSLSGGGIYGCHVNVVARNSGEYPFNNAGCDGANVIGCYAGGKSVYINTSFTWITGLTTQGPNVAYEAGALDNDQLNMTTTIAHEFGHFLGFQHSPPMDSIMNAMIYDGQNWQADSLISDLAKALY